MTDFVGASGTGGHTLVFVQDEVGCAAETVVAGVLAGDAVGSTGLAGVVHCCAGAVPVSEQANTPRVFVLDYRTHTLPTVEP